MLYSRRTHSAFLYTGCDFAYVLDAVLSQYLHKTELSWHHTEQARGHIRAWIGNTQSQRPCMIPKTRSSFTFVMRDLYCRVQDALCTHLLWGLQHDANGKNCCVWGEYVPVSSSPSYFTDRGEQLFGSWKCPKQGKWPVFFMGQEVFWECLLISILLREKTKAGLN